MNRVRLRGFLSVLAGAVIVAPGWYYLWLVDYRDAPLPAWGTSFAVAFMSPGVWLAFCGAFALVTGKRLPKSPVRLRL